MAIRRISELDLFNMDDLSMFWRTNPQTGEVLSDEFGQVDYDPQKLSVGLYIEVSSPLSGLTYYGDGVLGEWSVGPSNEVVSYYLSKKVPGNLIGELFGCDMRKNINRILSGPVFQIGSQNYGRPISSSTDPKDTYWYDPRSTITANNIEQANRLCVMVSADFTNTTTFHPSPVFHSGLKVEPSNSNNTVILSSGSSTYNWKGSDVTINDFGHVFDFIVDGTAYINNLKVNNDIDGTCLRAKWADLAENYASDETYPPGTLVQFGGTAEITIAKDTVNAVVTTRPGFCLNGSSMKGNIGIALVGRVPVRIVGKVKKFDMIGLSEIPGIGEAIHNMGGHHIGIALQSSDDEGEKLVECVVQLKI